MYANHPLFARDPKAIQILLYYDECEVVNPLGSKTSKHKFGKLNVVNIYIYFTIVGTSSYYLVPICSLCVHVIVLDLPEVYSVYNLVSL